MAKKSINIKETVDAAKAGTKKALEAAEPALTAAMGDLQAVAEPVVKKARETAEPVVKKAKETAEIALEKAAPTVDAAEKKVREGSRKIRAVMVPEVYIQAGGKEYDVADIQERCRAAYRADHKIGIHSMKVYIKPEESAAYYVINKETGKIDL